MTDETNQEQLIRLASEREGRINDLTDRVRGLEAQVSTLNQLRVDAEDEATVLRAAIQKMRKTARKAALKAYLKTLEAGK